MDDGKIIDLYWQRSERAIEATDRKYGTYCFTIADNILENREDSQECVNDTYLHAWDAMPPQKPNKLRMFLARITRNLAFDRYKARNTQKRGGELAVVLDELQECIPDSLDTEGQVLAKELESIIGAFVRELPQKERDLFVRRYFFAEPANVIARNYGMKPGTVSVTLSRIRAKLHAHLQKEGYVV